MSSEQIASLVAAAVLVFWMVGAYNLLVALRSAIGGAYAQVDDLLQKRGAAVLTLVDALREPMGGEQGALDALLAAQAQVRGAAEALRARPVMATLAAAVVAAESMMTSSSSRVLALLEQHPEVMNDGSVAPQVAALRDTGTRLGFARQSYNDATTTYNAAARQFPTRLLARLYGFGTAGRL
jgi:LemA protein